MANSQVITANWQVQILGNVNFDLETLHQPLTLCDKFGSSCIYYAAWSGNIKALEWINNNYPKAWKQKNAYGATPFHYAALSGNPKALEWINNHCLEAWQQKNAQGGTPFHFAAWSGNINALEWININHPEAWQQKNAQGTTPFDYAAWSGNPEALEWININHPEAWQQKNAQGNTPFHYAARSGNLEALEWINNNYPKAWKQKNADGATPFHFAAWSGNLEALEWININHPEAWQQKNAYGATPFHYAAWSGNLEALEWINNHFPESWQKKDKEEATSIHYAAYSGNSRALNKALFFSKNCHEWTLPSFTYDASKVLVSTLLKALESNYTLTSVHYGRCEIEDEAKATIESYLSRNRALQRDILAFNTFMQGHCQNTSSVSKLDNDSSKKILEAILPEGINKSQLIPKTVIAGPVKRALHYIDARIVRLQSSTKANNTFFFGLIPLYGFLNNSDNKIHALSELKKIIQETPNSAERSKQVVDWEKKNGTTIKEHRNLYSEFFSNQKTKTTLCVENAKSILQTKTT